MAARATTTNRSKRVDSVRASRDGHQFHEAWVAQIFIALNAFTPQTAAACVEWMDRAEFTPVHLFPDVGLREPARRALTSSLEGERSKAAARTIKKLQKVPVSAFRPVQGRIDTFGTMSWDRPKTAKKPKAPFHFDCDFDKHDLSRVGNIFGVPTWKIADRCVSWIRKQDLMVDGSRPASAHTASALSGSERYNPADDDSSDRLTHTYSLLLVDRQLRVRPIVPTSADVATVASLDTYSIHDFQKRFTALSKSRGE